MDHATLSNDNNNLFVLNIPKKQNVKKEKGDENKMNKNPRGFIAHPFETANGKYHASYDNHNKTVRSFNTKREAVEYLRNRKVADYMYDSPSGTRTTQTKQRKKRRVKRARSGGFGFPSFGNLRF